MIILISISTQYEPNLSVNRHFKKTTLSGI